MNDSIPPDFPLFHRTGSLSGAQLKFGLVQDQDGKFREAGARPSDRERDFKFCMNAVVWSVDLLKLKIEKPKYADLPAEAMLAKLKINLARDLDVPDAYQEWVLNQVARILGWNRD